MFGSSRGRYVLYNVERLYERNIYLVVRGAIDSMDPRARSFRSLKICEGEEVWGICVAFSLLIQII